ncbi:MAG: PKD domain-containing protein [Saccharospirillaceae bacterium]|nr:PKD domain-containing protein [Saccharospirillaceae bacterium]
MFLRSVFFCISVIFLISGCDPFGLDSSGEANGAPISSFEVFKQTNDRSYLFDSSASYDPEGDVLAYSWNFGDGTTSAASKPHHTFENDGEYIISLRVTDKRKTSNTEKRQIIVFTSVSIAAFSVEQTFGLVQLSATTPTTPTNNDQQLDFSWDFGDGSTTQQGETVSHKYTTSGVFTLQLTVTDSLGLVTIETQVITIDSSDVNQTPVAFFTSIQTGLAVEFDASQSIDPDGDNLTYLWDLDDSQNSNLPNFTHSYSAYKTYLVKLTITDELGAQHSYAKSIALINPDMSQTNQTPVASFVVAKDNLEVILDASTSNDVDNDALTYIWNMGDGQQSISVTEPIYIHNYTIAGSYNIELTVDDGQQQHNSIINVLIDNDFFNPLEVVFTQNGYQVVIDTTNGVSTNKQLDFVWTMGDTNEVVDLGVINYTYDQQGSYDIQLTVGDHQGNTILWNQELTIKLEDLTYNELSQKMSVEVVSALGCFACHNNDQADTTKFNFESNSVIHMQNALDTYFNQDVNALINLQQKPNGEHLHTDGFIFEAKPELRDYWNKYVDDTYIIWLGLNQTPVAAFEFDNIVNLLVAVNASTSVVNNTENIIYQWEYDSQISFGKAPILSFTQAGVFDIKLTVIDGDLIHSIIKPVTVTQVGTLNTPPTVLYSIAANYFQVNFDASDSVDNDGDDITYNWTINGEMFSDSIVDYTFEQAGTYVYVIEINDAIDSASITGVIEVIKPPASNKTPTAIIDANVNGLTLFLDAAESFDPEGDELQYLWTVNDEIFTTESLEYTFNNDDSYQIQLVVTDSFGVFDVDSITLNMSSINQAPSAKLYLFLNGSNLMLNGSGSTGPEAGVLTYRYLIDGQTYSGPIASHVVTQLGTYTVELTVTDHLGLSDSITQTYEVITTNNPPIANFEMSVNGLNVEFDASLSSDPDGDTLEYFWQFSGQNLTGVITNYSFGFANNYAVKLTVRDEHGLENIMTKSVSVAVPDNYAPVASFVLAQSFLHVALDASMSSDSDGSIVSYTWIINNQIKSGALLNYSFTEPGSYNIVLEVQDNKSATDTYSQIVTVIRDPDANNTPIPIIVSTVQAGQYIFFNAENSVDVDRTDILDYTWALSTGDVFYGSRFYYEADNNEVFYASLRVGDSKSSAVITEIITAGSGNIDREYDIEMFEMATQISCAGSCHSSSHPFIDRYNMTQWDNDFRRMLSEMGATELYEFPTGQAGGHEGDNAVGTINWNKWLNLIRLVDADVDVNKNQPPIVDFDLSVTGDSVSLIDNSFDPENATLSYKWEFGDSLNATTVNPVHTYTKSGQYVIKLTVDDGYTTKQTNKWVEVIF